MTELETELLLLPGVPYVIQQGVLTGELSGYQGFIS